MYVCVFVYLEQLGKWFQLGQLLLELLPTLRERERERENFFVLRDLNQCTQTVINGVCQPSIWSGPSFAAQDARQS